MNSIPKLLLLLLSFVCASAFTPPCYKASVRYSSSQSIVLHAVIEKEAPLKTPGPAVLEPQTDSDGMKNKTYRDRKDQRQGIDEWEVRIFNDGLNTREHVARSLVQITGMTESNAYKTMMQAHQNGLAVVGRYAYEIAEMYNEGLGQQGIVSDLIPVEDQQ